MGKVGVLVWCLVGTACGHDAVTGDAGGIDANGDGPPMLSCTGLPSTCGPAGTSSCCGSSIVPGGMFYRSYDVGTDSAYADMTNAAIVSDVRLDTYEVTVGRFRQFVNAGMGTQASPPPTGAGARTLNETPSQGGWDPTWNASLVVEQATLLSAVKCSALYQSWTDIPGGNESLPMNCVTWFEAMAFCAWDGGFLPTEAEWNYAAAGGSEQRAYPWSNPVSSLVIDCSYANYKGTSYCESPPAGDVNRVGSESPTGDGKWGQADLGGNVYEWVLDSYASYGNPCNDCADLAPSSYRILRGGGYLSDVLLVRGAFRSVAGPSDRIGASGVRCARTP